MYYQYRCDIGEEKSLSRPARESGTVALVRRLGIFLLTYTEVIN